MLRQIFGRMKTGTKKLVGIPFNSLDLLRADHMRVEVLAVKLRLSRDLGERKRLLRVVSDLLQRHMRIEEEIFYPACARIRRLSALIDHAHTDHQLFKNVLKDLAVLDPSTRQFNSLLMKAVKKIELHVHAEEDKVFGKARRLMSRSDFRRMNQAIIQAYESVPTQERRAA